MFQKGKWILHFCKSWESLYYYYYYHHLCVCSVSFLSRMVLTKKTSGFKSVPEEHLFDLWYFSSDRHIAHVVFFLLSLFMLRPFSMSWNAMFLVLLTLGSVIRFIINSFPNVWSLSYLKMVTLLIIVKWNVTGLCRRGETIKTKSTKMHFSPNSSLFPLIFSCLLPNYWNDLKSQMKQIEIQFKQLLTNV